MAYMQGRGHQHWGPGTSMTQFVPNGIMAGLGHCGSCCASCVTGAGPCKGLQSNGLMGMGLFESMDFTTWGIAEWGVIGIGVYLVLSFAGDVGRARKKVRRFTGRRTTYRRKAAPAAA